MAHRQVSGYSEQGDGSRPGQGVVRFHHAPQKGGDELFMSGIFHLIFSDCRISQITETSEVKL